MSANEATMLEKLQPLLGKPFGQYALTPIGKSLNATLVSADESGVTLAFVVREEMVNPAGTLHGGYMALMHDETIGMSTIVVSNGRFHATVNLTIDFLAPAQAGDTVTVRAAILRRGRRLTNVQAEMKDSGGTLISHASSNLIVVE